MNKQTFGYALLILSFVMLNIVSCSKKDEITQPVPPVNNCAGTPGPLFSAVRTLMNQKCIGCHNASSASGGQNWTVDCNVVSNKARIKARAVDEGTMPPTGTLPQADKNTISTWINAGGRITD
ncbi:MAG: hypothetical protein WKF89_06430 [Chitinophagaceae bacterium]